MKDVEIVVFQDKSWVRFSDYEKLEEENKQLKAQIEKMKICYNCESYIDDDAYDVCKTCYKYSEWELAE